MFFASNAFLAAYCIYFKYIILTEQYHIEISYCFIILLSFFLNFLYIN